MAYISKASLFCASGFLYTHLKFLVEYSGLQAFDVVQLQHTIFSRRMDLFSTTRYDHGEIEANVPGVNIRRDFV